MKPHYLISAALLIVSGCGGSSSDGRGLLSNFGDIAETSIFEDIDTSLDDADSNANVNTNVYGDPVFYGNNFLLQPDEEDYHQHEFDNSFLHPFKTYDEALAKEAEFIQELHLTLVTIYEQMDSRYTNYVQGITDDDIERYENDLDLFGSYEPGNEDSLDGLEFIYDVTGGGELEIEFEISSYGTVIDFGGGGGVVDNYGVNWVVNRERRSVCYSKFAHTLPVCSSLSRTENTALPHNTEYALLQAGIVNMRQIRTGIIE